MSFRLDFLLDTHLLVPLQDAYATLEDELKDFLRLTKAAGHSLLYHPATEKEFQRDSNLLRLQRNLLRLVHYTPLQVETPCPWNNRDTPDSAACDNEILFALSSHAVHALVTEDPAMHARARELGLQSRVHTIQMAVRWLQTLHEPAALSTLPIEDSNLRELLPALPMPFFDGLRAAYHATARPWQFDEWMQEKAQAGYRAWCCKDRQGALQALCIYVAADSVLQLHAFKISQSARSRHIGELFIAAAFRQARDSACEQVQISVDTKDFHVRQCLADFGFAASEDGLLVKPLPTVAPANGDGSAFEYAKRYFPHFRTTGEVQPFLVPIVPDQHNALFPDYVPQQGRLFAADTPPLSPIRQAYICRSDIKDVKPGDLLLFYRSKDEKAVTSIGIVEHFQIAQDPAELASLISRRSAFTSDEIAAMASRPVKVLLFRTAEHFPRAVRLDQLQKICEFTGPLNAIRQIQQDQLLKVLAAGRT